MTLGDLLLENRIILLQGEIHDGNANELVMKLLYLQSENRRKDIHFYINSPGGSVSATLAIYDTMQILSCPVATYCVGLAASGGAVLLAGGAKGKRFALPHAKVMIHQPYGQVGGPGLGHRNPGQRNPPDPRSAQPDPGQAHRPADRADRQGHRPRFLHDRRRGQGNTASWTTSSPSKRSRWTRRNSMTLIPYVIEKSGREERAMDIYSRLLKDRIVFLGSQINDEVANAIVAQMLFLQSDDPKADIHLYINSPGGSVAAGLAIYDTMQFVTCDVATYCVGQAASMGAVLLAAGTTGKRKALPNSRIMIHQPLAGMEGTAEDILIHAKEFVKVKERLNRILIKHTGHPLEKIEQDTDRDRFMSAEEALEYGLIDHVIERAGQA